MSTQETLPYGLKILAESTHPLLDIVAVHGLNGHREKTWMANDINWLRDFLPSDIPNARILTWGYDANTHSTSQISAQSLYDHAKTLVSDLSLKRCLTETRTRPIVFVAHSLGGIVVKSALIHSDAARKGALEEHRSIKLSTYGIFFMGTPHQGGTGVHLGELMLKVASIFMTTNDKILKHLEQDSEWLQQQLSQYGPISRDFVTKFAYETYPTVALGKKIMVVPHASAIIPGIADAESVAISADHLSMVKFTSREDGGYEKVSGYLKLLALEAPDAIDARWAEQRRMIEALSRIEKDFSIPFSLSGVPETKNFVGRDQELLEIKEEFQGNKSHRKTIILHGLGGIGKTQLAVKFLKEQRDTFSAIFWMNGKTQDMLKQSFVSMAKRLHNEYPSSALLSTAAESKDPEQVVEAMKRWLSAKGNCRWLLVFDNFDNPRLPSGINDPQAYDIKSYFPDAHQGFILITTRSSWVKVVGKVIQVKKLQSIGESIAILAHMSERQISDQDFHAVELAKTLDGLPLALATAGAYLCQVDTSLAEYLLHYSRSWFELQETSPELFSYEDRALYSTWNISFEHISRQNKSAGKLLQLLGYFDNQDIWYKLLAEGSDHSPEWFSSIIGDNLTFNKVIRLLCDHALIEPHGDSNGYRMHSCVHAWIMHSLNSKKDFSMAHLALTCVGYAVPDDTDSEYWTLQQRLLPHASRCLESIHSDFSSGSKIRAHILDAAHELGYLFSALDKMKEAEEMYLWALTGYKKSRGAGHTLTLDVVNNLAILYTKQGTMKEAEEMFLLVLAGREKALGAEHISTLNLVNNLGTLYDTQGRLEKAEEMYLRALKGLEKTLDTKNLSRYHITRNLGNLYRIQGKMEKAEKMLLWALKELENALGTEHFETLCTVNTLGAVYADQNKMEEAEKMYLRALTGFEKAQGAEHTSTLHPVSNLGTLYAKQGKAEKAEVMYLRALTGYEKVWGTEHTSMLNTVKKLGDLYSGQGKMEEAEVMYLRALTGYKNIWGTEHTSAFLTLNNNLGDLYFGQGKMEEAEEMYLRALTGFEKARGAGHFSTLTTVHNLAELYRDQGKMEESEKMYLQALTGLEKTLGTEHMGTLMTVHNLGDFYKIQGKMEEAEEMLLRALTGKEKASGAEHESTLDTIHLLGDLYLDQNKMEEAEEMYLRALTGREKALGTEHTSTVDTVHALGIVYALQGKIEKAKEMFLRVLTGCERLWGAEHERSLTIRLKMAILHQVSHQIEEAIAQLEFVVQAYTKVLGPDHPKTVNALERLNRLKTGDDDDYDCDDDDHNDNDNQDEDEDDDGDDDDDDGLIL